MHNLVLTFVEQSDTIAYLTDALSRALNAALDERPEARSARMAERNAIARKVANLIAAVESGNAGPSLLASLSAREDDLRRLDAELSREEEPLRDRLAVIPSWVGRQVSDVASLLRDAPERAKSSFSASEWRLQCRAYWTKHRARSFERSERQIFQLFLRALAPTFLYPADRSSEWAGESARGRRL